MERRSNKKDRSTKGLGEYLFLIALLMLVFGLLYKIAVFRPIGTLSGTQSLLVFAAVTGITVLSSLTLYVRYERNWVTLLITAFEPFSIFTFIAYMKTVTLFVWFAVSLAVFAGGLLFLNMENRNVKQKLFSGLLAVQTVFVLLMMFFTVKLIISRAFDSSILKADSGAVYLSADDDSVIEDNIGTLYMLDDEIWKGLNIRDKLEVLQIVADIERRELGIDHALSVEIVNLDQEIYSDRSAVCCAKTNDPFSVAIDILQIVNLDATTSLQLVFHSCYHSYQHELVELWDTLNDNQKRLLAFEDAEQYKWEFSNYITADIDNMNFTEQLCERNTRDYAVKRDIYFHSTVMYYAEKHGYTESQSSKPDNDRSKPVDMPSPNKYYDYLRDKDV